MKQAIMILAATSTLFGSTAFAVTEVIVTKRSLVSMSDARARAQKEAEQRCGNFAVLQSSIENETCDTYAFTGNYSCLVF